MNPDIPQRVKIFQLCCSRNWSAAIEALNVLLFESKNLQDYCNRAFCNSQLQNHEKIKDCDKVLEGDRTHLRACILKGCAFYALGKKDEAIAAWKQGKGQALGKSFDLKQLLELEQLLIASDNPVAERSTGLSEKLDNTSDTNDETSVDFLLSTDVAQVNEEDPTNPEAIQRVSEAAIADFTKDVEAQRRSCVQVASGQYTESIEHLTASLELNPFAADILYKRGSSKRKVYDFDAAIEDLSACVKLDENNKFAYTLLGMALSLIGEYGRAETALLKSIKLDRSYIRTWMLLAKLYRHTANSKKAFDCLQQVLQIDKMCDEANHIRGLLLYEMGEPREAIKDFSNGLSINNSNIEYLFLRASCYHAIGEYDAAVKDYDVALDIKTESMGRYHWLAYYQRRIALYTASKFNTKFSQFDIDGDFDTLFKECWCKVFPTDTENALLMVARQQPSLSLKGGKLKEQDMGSKKNKAALLVAADSIGKKIQYDCPGFLSNRRKYRMAGLAAIEIAQMVSKEWYSLHRRKIRIDFSQNRGGAACTSTSRVLMSWQEIYSSAVRWMQISDPFNKVLWLNKLREDFNSEFFCHMPIVLEQTKSVRYFPHYERILNVTKLIMREKLYVHNKGYEAIDLSKEGKSKDIEYAKTFDELCEHVGEEFFATTWCSSTAVDGRQLQGSTINIFKSRQQRGYDVFIKTSCPSSRCQDFDIEMNAAWAAICNSYCGDNFGSTDFKALQSLTEAIVRMTYYWYNYKPLSCDAEVVGFVVLLGLLLAANMNFAGNVPKGVQVDLEAILNFDPDYFVDSVESWLYPSINISSSWRDLPDVASTFSTTGCSPQ